MYWGWDYFTMLYAIAYDKFFTYPMRLLNLIMILMCCCFHGPDKKSQRLSAAWMKSLADSTEKLSDFNTLACSRCESWTNITYLFVIRLRNKNATEMISDWFIYYCKQSRIYFISGQTVEVLVAFQSVDSGHVHCCVPIIIFATKPAAGQQQGECCRLVYNDGSAFFWTNEFQ